MAERKDKKDVNHEPDHIDELLEEDDADVELNSAGELEARLKEAEEKVLRIAAESDNFRKRITRETDEKIKYANQKMLENFLPVMDNFDLAVQHLDAASTESVVEGIKHNHRLMLDTLEKAGLSVVKVARGDVFDPMLHEAILLAQDPELPDNTVAMVVQNGYRMGDRVVRPAKVQVNKLS